MGKWVLRKARHHTWHDAKRGVLDHFRKTEAELGYSSPMCYDLDGLDVSMMKKMGYRYSITGRELRETNRVILGFFSGGTHGCFLVHHQDVSNFIDTIFEINASYGIIQMKNSNREDAHFLGKEHCRFVYDKKIVLLLERESIKKLAEQGRIMPNPFLIGMLPMLHRQKAISPDFVEHIKNLENIMMFGLKWDKTPNFVSKRGFRW